MTRKPALLDIELCVKTKIHVYSFLQSHEESLPENSEGVNSNNLSIEEIKASFKYIDEKVVALGTAKKKKKKYGFLDGNGSLKI